MTQRIKMFWVFVLYFVEGLPFGVFNDALPIYFRMHGATLGEIGMMSLFSLPWSAKVLWSPIVDRVGTLRRWIVGALAVLTLTHLGLALYNELNVSWALWILLALLTTSAATQDVAIDGYFVRIMERGQEGLGNGLRVTAYRVALIFAGGGAVALAGVVSWTWIFVALAATCLFLAACVWRAPSVDAPDPQPLDEWLRALWLWFKQPGSLGVFAFVLLYKLGDSSMAAMVKPFWVDQGLRAEEIGLITTTFGIGATIAGALSGGWYTSRAGIFTSLWVMGLAQAFSNLGYTLVAWLHVGRLALYAAALVESFTAGLGAAALLALLTAVCDRRHAATQYAAMSALFGLTRALAGAASGHAATVMGYGPYFLLTFALSFPAFVLLPWVKTRLRRLDETRSPA